MVGVLQALDGSMRSQLDPAISSSLMAKTTSWAQKIHDGWLNWHMAWMALNTMVWPSLAFQLKACSLSKKEGDRVMAKLCRALLPELGVNCRFPCLWWYGPRCYQGLDIPYPYMTQGIKHIWAVMA